MKKPPHQVMRFYGNLQYALECIAFKQITFLHRDKLNDPFDPYFYFETDFDEDYQPLLEYVKKHHAGNLWEFLRRCPKEGWELSVKQIQDHLNMSSNSLFVFSTIEINEDKHPKDNLYMWSHYGDGHRGIAIEFDTTLLANAVLKKQERLGGVKLDPWSGISYQDELPEITCEHIFQYCMTGDETELENIMKQRFSSKSMVWKTEKEWRLMWRNDETRLKVLRLDLLDDTITSIHLGCRIADNIKDDFIFETKRNFPKAEIFKAKKAKGRFALDFERIAAAS